MGTDTDGVVGKIRAKAKDFFDAEGEGPGAADPDVEYEPAPDQKVLHDGMVVLSESQSAQFDDRDGGNDGKASHVEEADGSGAAEETEQPSG